MNGYTAEERIAAKVIDEKGAPNAKGGMQIIIHYSSDIPRWRGVSTDRRPLVTGEREPSVGARVISQKGEMVQVCGKSVFL